MQMGTVYETELVALGGTRRTPSVDDLSAGPRSSQRSHCELRAGKPETLTTRALGDPHRIFPSHFDTHDRKVSQIVHRRITSPHQDPPHGFLNPQTVIRKSEPRRPYEYDLWMFRRGISRAERTRRNPTARELFGPRRGNRLRRHRDEQRLLALSDDAQHLCKIACSRQRQMNVAWPIEHRLKRKTKLTRDAFSAPPHSLFVHAPPGDKTDILFSTKKRSYGQPLCDEILRAVSSQPLLPSSS